MAVDLRSTADPILDIDGTLARFGGDKDLFIEMSGIVLEDAPRVFSNLCSAVETQDAAAIRSHAHALKGLLAGCGGVRAAKAAQILEDAGNSARLENSIEMLRTLETEFESLSRALERYRS
jgi:HPt (histidine-containing phosphotransfer) domain-containing protein